MTESAAAYADQHHSSGRLVTHLKFVDTEHRLYWRESGSSIRYTSSFGVLLRGCYRINLWIHISLEALRGKVVLYRSWRM